MTRSPQSDLTPWILTLLQEPEDQKTLCSSYFHGEPIPGLTDAIKKRFQINENLWKKENLTYK